MQQQSYTKMLHFMHILYMKHISTPRTTASLLFTVMATSFYTIKFKGSEQLSCTAIPICLHRLTHRTQGQYLI